VTRIVSPSNSALSPLNLRIFAIASSRNPASAARSSGVMAAIFSKFVRWMPIWKSMLPILKPGALFGPSD
jgi:hypothetical protein